MKKILLLLLLTVSGCAQVTLTLPYTPQTTEEISGQVEVNDFKYFPPQGVKQNEIKETAAGFIYLTEPVGEYVTKAVKREFRQAGINISGKNICSLDGEINQFLIDSLGFSVTYTSDIRYILYDKKGKALYDNNQKVNFNASKFVAPEIIIANINKVIADNINKFLTDEEFKKSIRKSCTK